MQAIRTVYLAPTNSRGSRIKASAQAGSVTVSWSYDLDVQENHEAAAIALRNKFGWTGGLVCGQLSDGSYAHVFKGK